MKPVILSLLALSSALIPIQAQASDVTVADVNRVIGPIENQFGGMPGRFWASSSSPLLGNGDMGVCLLSHPQGFNFMLGKNDFWHLKSQNKHATALGFGLLSLDIPELKSARPQLTQKPLDAQLAGTVLHKDGSGLAIRTYVAAKANVLVVELTAKDKPLKVSATLTPDPIPKLYTFKGSVKSGSDDGLTWLSREFTENVDIPTGGSAVLKVVGAKGSAFTLEPGKTVTLMVSLQTNFDAKDHLASAKKLVQSADASKLLTDHKAWWTEFWRKSFVDVADPALMHRYYMAHYVMASASRNPKFSTGIIGPWITSNTHIFACGSYWMNYNHAAPYYGLYSSNHIEQADPQDVPILEFIEKGRQYAKDILKIRGVLYPIGIGPKGIDITYGSTRADGHRYVYPNVEIGKILTWHQRSNAAYNLVNMGVRWRTTHDPVYAKRIYPYALAVATFWEDFLVLKDNRYVIEKEAVQEGTGHNTNSIASLGLVRNAFRLVLEMSKEMGIDQKRRAKWQDIVNRLSEYPTIKQGTKSLFILSEKGPRRWKDNTLHIQHIYPAGQIGLDSDPKLLKIAHDTLASSPRWYDYNGSNSFFPMAARIGHDPSDLLHKLRVYPIQANGFLNNNPHGIENCSTVPNTLNEMLMQSHEGVLRFFPVWPKATDARFVQLRAYGAFLVSSKLSNGTVQGVKIHSERGLPCTVLNPWPKGEAVLLRKGKPAEILTTERVTFKTKPGETLYLGLKGSTAEQINGQLMLPPATPAKALINKKELGVISLLDSPKSITLTAAPGASMHYTVDGNRPTTKSAAYKAPIEITKPCTLRILTTAPDFASNQQSFTFQGPEKPSQWINTFDTDADLKRTVIKDYYPEEPPHQFTTQPTQGYGIKPLAGKEGILRLHPKAANEPAVIERLVTIPVTPHKTKLRLVTIADSYKGGSVYVLQVGIKPAGKETTWLKEELITAKSGWQTRETDLTPYAGQTILIQIRAGAGGRWQNNRAYFDEISIISDTSK